MGRRHRKPRRSPEPLDVLAGRVELKPAELIELIHRVNPTGRELDATREAERYRQKAELQSLLIRRYGDEHLEVTPAEDEGVVSLSHRSASRDACHAVLDELDLDARAWVRRHLDLAAFGDAETAGDDALELRDRRRIPPPASAPGPVESPEGLLATAEEALEEYDYDRAERCLRQALPPFHCSYPPMADAASHLQTFQNASLPELEDALQHVVDDMLLEEAIVVLSWLLVWKKDWLEAVGRSIHELAARHPGLAGTLLLQAEHRAMEGRWTEARGFLEKIPLWRLGTVSRCHVRHLLGLSWLFEGQTKKARKIFRRALYNVKRGGNCPILPLYHLVRPMKDPPRPKEWGPSEPFVRQLLGAVRTADAALRAGDPEAARRAIDHPIVWRMEELQSAARLASVYLDTPASKPGERFRKRLALAFFRHLWAREPSLLRRELPLPDLRWDRPRLEDLARRSAEWLAGD